VKEGLWMLAAYAVYPCVLSNGITWTALVEGESSFFFLSCLHLALLLLLCGVKQPCTLLGTSTLLQPLPLLAAVCSVLTSLL